MRALRIVLHTEGGTWWADSPDVPGWTAAASSRDELLRLVDGADEFVFDCKPYVLCEGVIPSGVYVS